jgi:hypothetical protein
LVDRLPAVGQRGRGDGHRLNAPFPIAIGGDVIDLKVSADGARAVSAPIASAMSLPALSAPTDGSTPAADLSGPLAEERSVRRTAIGGDGSRVVIVRPHGGRSASTLQRAGG